MEGTDRNKNYSNEEVGEGKTRKAEMIRACVNWKGSGTREARVMRSDCLGWKKFVNRDEWPSAGTRETLTLFSQ